MRTAAWQAQTAHGALPSQAPPPTQSGRARRITITAITVDAVLAGGVVARGWSSYLAVLVRTPCFARRPTFMAAVQSTAGTARRA